MRNLDSLAKLMLVSAFAVACFPAPASAAVSVRSLYQNASASCHGSSPADEARLQRTEQRMKNTSTTTDANVVCSLATNPLAIMSANNGTVTYVAIWTKRSSAPAVQLRRSRGHTLLSNDSLTCTMMTSFADDQDSVAITKTVNNLPIASPGGGQAALEWFAPLNEKFLSPINLACTLHPQVELNDWLVMYEVEVGS